MLRVWRGARQGRPSVAVYDTRMVGKRPGRPRAPKSGGGIVVPFPPLPRAPRPPRLPPDPRQRQASHIIGAIAGAARRSMRLVGPDFASGFHASSVDMGRLQAALARGVAGLDMRQVDSRWDEVREWMLGVLRTWVQRYKKLHIERRESGVRVELETQDDQGCTERERGSQQGGWRTSRGQRGGRRASHHPMRRRNGGSHPRRWKRAAPAQRGASPCSHAARRAQSRPTCSATRATTGEKRNRPSERFDVTEPSWTASGKGIRCPLETTRHEPRGDPRLLRVRGYVGRRVNGSAALTGRRSRVVSYARRTTGARKARLTQARSRRAGVSCLRAGAASGARRVDSVTPGPCSASEECRSSRSSR
jgi:hypothetical protein